MATGIEVWFGYTYPEYHKKAPITAPRLPWPLPTDGSEDGPLEEFPDRFDEWSGTLDEALQAAHHAACVAVGWKPVPKPKKKKSALPQVFFETPARETWNECGTEFSPFGLAMEWGGEMEFELPEVPIGVALSGRYRPVFLDYATDGCLPNPLVIWTPETKKMIEIARGEIVKRVAWLLDAKPMVVEIHY
jgi:hypothetical protein